MKEAPWTHTIRTRSHAMLLQAATIALETARLAIVRGPAGIGKTYGLDLIEDKLSKDGTQIFRVMASADKSASVKKFFEKAVFDLGLMGHGGSDPVERLAGYLMRSYPFRPNGPRVLLVIDECQHLTAKILETLRSIYDRGQWARDFDPDAPAFGMLLVGNPHFLTRGGKAERAAFDALLSRGPIEWELSRPSSQEYADLAEAYFPDDEALRERIRALPPGHKQRGQGWTVCRPPHGVQCGTEGNCPADKIAVPALGRDAVQAEKPKTAKGGPCSPQCVGMGKEWAT